MPTLASLGVAKEVEIVPGLIKRLSLDAPIEEWTAAVRQLRKASLPNPKEAREKVTASPLNIHHQLATTRTQKHDCDYDPDTETRLSAIAYKPE